MPNPSHCPKCSGTLVRGFVVDTAHGTHVVPTWVEGAPERSIWTGLKLTGRPRSEIATWRCKSCGFLENYALAAPDRSQEAAQGKQALLVLGIAVAVLGVLLGAVLVLK
jgi:hypothetical protein